MKIKPSNLRNPHNLQKIGIYKETIGWDYCIKEEDRLPSLCRKVSIEEYELLNKNKSISMRYT